MCHSVQITTIQHIKTPAQKSGGFDFILKYIKPNVIYKYITPSSMQYFRPK